MPVIGNHVEFGISSAIRRPAAAQSRQHQRVIRPDRARFGSTARGRTTPQNASQQTPHHSRTLEVISSYPIIVIARGMAAVRRRISSSGAFPPPRTSTGTSPATSMTR